MNHNLNLNPDGVTAARQALDDIAHALAGLDHDDQRGEAPVMERLVRILPCDLFNELRAYLGSIAEARWQLDQLLFWIAPDDAEYGIENHLRPANPARVRLVDDCPVCDQDDTVPRGCSACQPSLIAASKLRHPSNGANLQRAMALVVGSPDHELEALLDQQDTLRDLLAQVDRGIITLREFQMSLDRHGISQAHPCITDGCLNTVPFDDEPRCFTHSPDEGSSLRGWSYLRAHFERQARANDAIEF